MNMMPIKKNVQRGALLITMIIILVIVGLLATLVSRMLQTNSESSVSDIAAVRAQYIGHGALEKAIEAMLNTDRTRLSSRVACSGINADANVNQGTLGEGAYTLTASQTNPTPTSLSSALSDSATTISVNSTSGFSDAGRIMVGNELIDYTGKTATTFTGASRGAGGTTAASHASSTSVSENACTLNVLAGVPSVSASGNYSRREYSEQVVQLPDGWAVGESDGSKTTLLRYNGASWQATGPHSGIPNLKMNGISLISNSDVWVIGDNNGGDANLNHWDGSTWTNFVPTGSAIPRDLNAISCVDKNNCWAVGDADAGFALIIRWNGISWTRVAISVLLNVPTENLLGITCNSTTDCWAVGNDSSANFVMYGNYLNVVHWNGTNWQHVTPLDNVRSPLTNIYCTSSSDCWAVGDAEGSRALIMHYDGADWTRLASGNQTTVPNADLSSVFCLSASECWAVGDTTGGEANINKWDGTNWTHMDTTELNGLPALDLTDIYCTRSDDCWTVGQSSVSKSTLAHWDGNRWTQFDDGNLGTEDLYGVRVVTPSSVKVIDWQDAETAT